MAAIEAIPSLLGAAAVVPGLLYLMSLTLLDQRREPPAIVVLSFLFGASSVLGIALFRGGIGFLTDLDLSDGLWGFIQSFVAIAAPEETAKVLVLVVVARRFIATGHPMEGVVYGAAVGLGFAAYENLGLLLTQPDAWQRHMAVRSIVTVPVHAALGIVAGIYIAQARARGGGGAAARPSVWKCYLRAWLVPVALHGLYDYPLLLARIGTDHPTAAISGLRSLGFVVGLLVILFCARRVYSVAAAQHTAHGPFGAGWPAGYRAWRLHVLGGLASLAGTLMLLIEFRDFLHGEHFALDRHVAVLAGSALLAAATLSHRRASRHHRIHAPRPRGAAAVHLR